MAAQHRVAVFQAIEHFHRVQRTQAQPHVACLGAPVLQHQHASLIATGRAAQSDLGQYQGSLTSLMVTMKGLPLAYSKDMQDDKPPVFEAAGLLDLSLAAMAGMVADTAFQTERMRKAAEAGHATATDLADWLVRQADIPFREAHHITGAAVKLADEKGVALDGLAIADLKAIDARIDESVFDALSVDASVAARASYGGTAPVRVREQVEAARKRLETD